MVLTYCVETFLLEVIVSYRKKIS